MLAREVVAMRLYEHPESGNSHKVRLLLSFLGRAYESVGIDLMADEQHQAAFLALNPRGEVPVLEDEGTVLCDSMAILVYVALKYDQGIWLPRDPKGMGEVMEWLAFAASWIQYGVFTARPCLVRAPG
jgi:glutathione S-transferase